MSDSPFAITAQTMLVVMCMSAVLMSAVVWFACAGRFRGGLFRWAVSLWAQALAWLLLAGETLPPAVLTVAAANGLLALTWVLQIAAIREFRGQRTARLAIWILPVLASGATLMIAEVVRSPNAVGHLLYGTGNLLIAFFLLRPPRRPLLRARWLLGACYALSAATLMIAAWMQARGAPSALTGSYGGFAYLGTYVFIVAGSFAFLLMHKERADEETSRLATTDPLTGVFNRRTFIELADQELARSRRAGTPLSLMMLDLDHFKRVNDTFGHLVGDEVLVAFTRLIRDCVRRGDLVVRYGGEEFCVLLPGTTLTAATALAERIRATCSAQALTAHAFKVSVSIGLTAYAGDSNTTLGDLLARADEALYLAKDEGRDRVIALPLSTLPSATQRALPLEQVG
ncbi:MAG: diguanylate cyclase [Betaproteobacteria bacterium]